VPKKKRKKHYWCASWDKTMALIRQCKILSAKTAQTCILVWDYTVNMFYLIKKIVATDYKQYY